MTVQNTIRTFHVNEMRFVVQNGYGSRLPPFTRLPFMRRSSSVRVRSGSDNSWLDSIKKASSFVQKMKNDLPIIGLVSKLTTPTNVGEESAMSYQEFSRGIYDAINQDFNTTCYDIQEKYGVAGQLRYMLFVLWMARQSFGGIPPKNIIQSATRLRGSRDLEFEITQFEAIREEERQKYGFGEVIDYTPKNLVPTAVDALVRLIIGITEEKEVDLEAEELLTKLILYIFPQTSRVDVQDAFKARAERAYLYK